jgi:hypothetical protein
MKKPRKSYYWRCESAPLHLKARRMHTTSPISTGRIAVPIIYALFLCSANSTGAKSLIPLRLLFQNSPTNWVVLTGNGNKQKTRRRLTLTIKHCPAPWSEAHTHRLTPVPTHLSFRWTLPLRMKRGMKKRGEGNSS